MVKQQRTIFFGWEGNGIGNSGKWVLPEAFLNCWSNKQVQLCPHYVEKHLEVSLLTLHLISRTGCLDSNEHLSRHQGYTRYLRASLAWERCWAAAPAASSASHWRRVLRLLLLSELCCQP